MDVYEEAKSVYNQTSFFISLSSIRIQLQRILPVIHTFPHTHYYNKIFDINGERSRRRRKEEGFGRNDGKSSNEIVKKTRIVNVNGKEAYETCSTNGSDDKVECDDDFSLINAKLKSINNKSIYTLCLLLMLRNKLNTSDIDGDLEEIEDLDYCRELRTDKKRRYEAISDKSSSTEVNETSIFLKYIDRVWISGGRDECLALADHWKKKTQIPSHRGFKVLDQSPSAQFRHMLKSYPKLLASTRPSVSNPRYKIYGLKENPSKEELIYSYSNIYDDQDWYMALLKEVMTCGLADKLEDVVLRQTQTDSHKAGIKKTEKRSNTYDRRASKGRKLRFAPIPKLTNFMSSRPRPPNLSLLPGLGDPTFIDNLINSIFKN